MQQALYQFLMSDILPRFLLGIHRLQPLAFGGMILSRDTYLQKRTNWIGGATDQYQESQRFH